MINDHSIQKSSPIKSEEEINELIRLGFVNSSSISKVISEEKRKRSAAIYLYKYFQVLEKTDYKAILIRREDFNQIMKKYKLICGLFKDYTGEVPSKCLPSIVDGEKIITESYIEDVPKDVLHISKVSTIYGLSRENFEIMDNIIKVPFIDYNYYVTSKWDLDAIRIGDETSSSNHCAVGDIVQSYIHSVFDKEIEIYKTKTSGKIEKNLFICAPRNEFINGSGVQLTEDPLICSLTNIGKGDILCWTAWGEESEGELINRYRELNSQLKDKAGSIIDEGKKLFFTNDNYSMYLNYNNKKH